MSPEPADRARSGPEHALVVLNYGSHALLEANLASMEVDDLSVIVVDNHSTDAERDVVAALAGRYGWTFLPQPDNRGFSAGINAGVRAAAAQGCRSVLLLNPDAVAPAATLAALFAEVDDDPSALVAPRIDDTTGGVYFAGAEVQLPTGRIRGRRAALAAERRLPAGQRRDWLTGACLAFSVDLWRRADGLDEDYFLYWEDVDFSLRCARAGARLLLREDLTARHDEGGTHRDAEPNTGVPAAGGSRAKSSTYYRYNCRNRLLFAAKHLRRPARVRWLLATPRESWLILMRGGKRQLLESRAPLWATLRGSAEGIGLLLGSLRHGLGD